MTQRSIQARANPTVIIRAGADVQVEGRDEERVVASTDSRWGLQVERGSESEVARVRAKVGEQVWFDVAFNGIGKKNKVDPQAIQVKIGSSGKVYVPSGSIVKIYAGKNVVAQNLQGSVTASAGGSVQLRNVHTLVNASAGGAMDLDCETLEPGGLKFSSGSDLRFYIHNLDNVKISVNDLGGYWEGIIGEGQRKIRLSAGGDVTLVTQREVKGQPPNFILGNIETPL
ncbi:MAG: hypothetical protein HZB51_08225 [Chloroflexi bacterium]|nr:hypothetical protein [Chloroflexota bacterium]